MLITPQPTPTTAGPLSEGPVLLVANTRSGRAGRDRDALKAARRILDAEYCPFNSVEDLRLRFARQKPRLVVAAGGDGTAMGVASAVLGTDLPFAALPLGTFNYFARGLGFSEDPREAAEQVLTGVAQPQRIGCVNGQPFLNNASLGIYPSILKQREDIYARYGRHRAMAHLSVLSSFARFRGPMDITLDFGDHAETRRTALIFVARSAFQLARFGLSGARAIEDDKMAILVTHAKTRADLFRMTARLAAGIAEEGVDYDLICADQVTLHQKRRRKMLLAYDGEKRRMAGPLRFSMAETPLQVVVPQEAA